MKALLVVSFGTTYPETREKTIGAIENKLISAFPDRRFYRAWTSRFICRRLSERDGMHIDSPEEAFRRMKEDGVTDILIQPTHVLPGAEYRKLLDAVSGIENDFGKVAVGAPLLSSEEDLSAAASALCLEFSDLEDDEALVLMGHGSPEGGNEIYLQLEEKFHGAGFVHVFIGTVEAVPTLEDVLTKVRQSGCRKVRLAPLLVVAGDHALNDMAGEDPGSWASVFRETGYSVRCSLQGIGEYEGIQNLYVSHAETISS